MYFFCVVDDCDGFVGDIDFLVVVGSGWLCI